METDRQRWDRRYRDGATGGPRGPSVFLARFEALLTGGLALDVACGLGQNALWLAQRGYTVNAIDVSPIAIGRLRRAARRQELPVRAHVADLTRVHLPTDRYDLVVDCFYLDRDMIPHLKTAVRPGGIVLLQTMNQSALLREEPANPAHLLKPGELAAWFQDFEVLCLEDDPQGSDVSGVLARRPLSETFL
ncbi:MAG: class I SAM-dependent methyltransferase [Chloroflexi bacterium]|nr:class I SAM-dependent methyltransferase [Chloroflexota bacterium]